MAWFWKKKEIKENTGTTTVAVKTNDIIVNPDADMKVKTAFTRAEDLARYLNDRPNIAEAKRKFLAAEMEYLYALVKFENAKKEYGV